MAPRIRRSRGFTALELLTTVAIVAIVATAAVPAFTRLERSAGMSTAANELLWALHFARSTAILRAEETRVCLTADLGRCIESADAQAIGWLVVRGNETPLRTFRLPPTLEVRGTRTAVTFWPTARAGTTSTFLICDGERGRAVVVSQTGRPRVESGDGSCRS